MKKKSTLDFVANGLALLTAFISIGCSVPSKQIIPVASEGKPPPGKCLIIVERESGATDQLVVHEVYDNQTLVGNLTSQGGKMVWLRDPGPLVLRSKVTWPDQPNYYRILNTAAGKAYHYYICDKPLRAGDLKLLDGPGARHIIVYNASKPVFFENYVGGFAIKVKLIFPICQDCGDRGSGFNPGCPLEHDSVRLHQIALADSLLHR